MAPTPYARSFVAASCLKWAYEVYYLYEIVSLRALLAHAPWSLSYVMCVNWLANESKTTGQLRLLSFDPFLIIRSLTIKKSLALLSVSESEWTEYFTLFIWTVAVFSFSGSMLSSSSLILSCFGCLGCEDGCRGVSVRVLWRMLLLVHCSASILVLRLRIWLVMDVILAY